MVIKPVQRLAARDRIKGPRKATDMGVSFEHGDPMPRACKVSGSGQPGKSGTNNGKMGHGRAFAEGASAQINKQTPPVKVVVSHKTR